MRSGDRIVEAHGIKFVRMESGRLISFLEAIGEAEKSVTRLARWLARAQATIADDYDMERIERILGEQEDLVARHRQALQHWRAKRTLAGRIEALRNTAGRTPAEAALYEAKADELEGRGAA
jgi:hypothetical protein